MTVSVLVVGDRTQATNSLDDKLPASEFSEILKTQCQFIERGHGDAYTHVLTCDDPAQLAPLLDRVVGASTIDILDIFDHGAPGLMQLGGKTLFEMIGDHLVGGDTIQELQRVVRPTGCVRLLGCNTGLGPEGQQLLRALYRATSFRMRIYGTITRILRGHFSQPGFGTGLNELFSCEAAVDYPAPMVKQRAANLNLC